VLDVIGDRVPPNEEKAKNQDNGEKGERKSDPVTDRQFPPAIVQPM
jgi:hypothetical protein